MNGSTAAADAPPAVHGASLVRRRVADLSRERWGDAREVDLVGEHPALAHAIEQAARFASADGPVLVTGETGTGKELFARTVYLLSQRSRKPFLAVNCAQYHDGQLLASELFGHRRGAFTGAVSDHRGVFEEADGGVVFLDEIGELSIQAQAMLLRALGEGEVLPVGTTQSKRVNVRVIAATSRDLRPMIGAGRFREDLYYRLRHLQLRVPPLRERGDDWRLVLEHYLRRLVVRETSCKQFSRHALSTLNGYGWPGNIRELRSVVETGYCLSDGPLIEVEHIAESLEAADLERAGRSYQWQRVTVARDADMGHGGAREADAPARAGRPRTADDAFEQLSNGEGTFWDLIHRPYLHREMSRADVRHVVERGLTATRGSYKRVVTLFGCAAGDYLRFMDFLRHHDLKPPG